MRVSLKNANPGKRPVSLPKRLSMEEAQLPTEIATWPILIIVKPMLITGRKEWRAIVPAITAIPMTIVTVEFFLGRGKIINSIICNSF